MFQNIESRVSQCPIDGTVLTTVEYEPGGDCEVGGQFFDFSFTAGTGITRLQCLIWENQSADLYDLKLVDTHTTTLRWDRTPRITTGL